MTPIPNTTQPHKFNIGDNVQHSNIPTLVGVVEYQLMSDDTFLSWYGVRWNLHTIINHESQDSLTKL
jgi:hypothetical protein